MLDSISKSSGDKKKNLGVCLFFANKASFSFVFLLLLTGCAQPGMIEESASSTITTSPDTNSDDEEETVMRTVNLLIEGSGHFSGTLTATCQSSLGSCTVIPKGSCSTQCEEGENVLLELDITADDGDQECTRIQQLDDLTWRTVTDDWSFTVGACDGEKEDAQATRTLSVDEDISIRVRLNDDS